MLYACIPNTFWWLFGSYSTLRMNTNYYVWASLELLSRLGRNFDPADRGMRSETNIEIYIFSPLIKPNLHLFLFPQHVRPPFPHLPHKIFSPSLQGLRHRAQGMTPAPCWPFLTLLSPTWPTSKPHILTPLLLPPNPSSRNTPNIS